MLCMFFNCDGIGGAYFRANRVPHIATAITFNGDLICRRRVNNAEGAYHHTHPTRNACRFMNIYQFCFGVAAHGTIGARIQTGRLGPERRVPERWIEPGAAA